MSTDLRGVFDAIPAGYGTIGLLSSDEFLPVAEPFDRALLAVTGKRVALVFAADPRGAARTSGLYLDHAQTEPAKFGVCKAPVATGRGSGGLSYDIVPGMPDMSILMYRISSTEPEIRMPELGRNLVHAEGVALIREWIEQLAPASSPSAAGGQ